MDTLPVDLIGSFTDLLGSAICTAKASIDKLFTVFVQQVEGVQVRAGGDLDQFRKAISDLGGREGSKEGEVEKGMHRRMISA